MEAGTGAAIVAAAAAVASALYAASADFRSRRAVELAESVDQRERERHDRERSAELEIVAAGFLTSGRHGNRKYGARVRNIGAAVARRARVWIVDGHDEEPLGLLAHRSYAADLTIKPDDDLEVELDLGAAQVTDRLRFCVSWTDATGDYVADGPMCPRSRDLFLSPTLVRWPDAKPPRREKPPAGV
jgi:hypothetical protein